MCDLVVNAQHECYTCIYSLWRLEPYAKMSVQYLAIFKNCKTDNLKMKIFDIFIIFAQNIHVDCGYTLEPPQ